MHARTNACGSSIRRQSWCKYPQGLLLGVLCGWSLKSFPQRTRSFTEVATEVILLAKYLAKPKILAVREGESKRKTTHSCTDQSEGDNHVVEKYVCGDMCASLATLAAAQNKVSGSA